MALKIALMPSRYNRTDLFEAAGFETYEAPARSPEELIDVLQDADAALVTTRPLTTRAVLESCPKLKVVSRMGVGVDSIDLSAATERGICVCNVPGVNTAEVADHAVALLLAVTRQLPEAITSTREGQWSDPARVSHFQRSVRRIAGHTVGIVGFGNIGRAFARRIEGFGPARIIAIILCTTSLPTACVEAWSVVCWYAMNDVCSAKRVAVSRAAAMASAMSISTRLKPRRARSGPGFLIGMPLRCTCSDQLRSGSAMGCRREVSPSRCNGARSLRIPRTKGLPDRILQGRRPGARSIQSSC